MRKFLDTITRLSLRFRWITVAVTALLIGLGVYSYSNLNQELIPDIEFPQAFIFSQNGGASSDNMLHMYGVPLENAAQDVDGVVNVESTSSDGFVFITVRNEFGLDQDRINEELQDGIDALQLPVRRLEPPDGMSVRDLIEELDSQHTAWLYTYAQDEGIVFTQQLNEDVWRSFSQAGLSGFPVAAFNSLSPDFRDELLTKRGEASAPTVETPPELPPSWQQNEARFATTADIAEMASTRNLASVFNTFYEDGYLVGPLVTASDLTAEDVALFIEIEERCRQFRIDNNNPTLSTSEDPCSFVKELDAAVVLAIPAEWLPEDYAAQLSVQDRNRLAQVQLARSLTGENVERSSETELPDAWQAEPATLLTFGIDDFPLSLVTVSSDTMSSQELRNYVENELVPALKSLDNVADVTISGGETIPPYVLNPELEEVGLEPLATTDGESATPDNSQQDDDPSPDNDQSGSESSSEAGTEIPQLNASAWQPVANALSLEELDSADDFLAPATHPETGEEITGLEIINLLAANNQAAFLIQNELPAEALIWLGNNDPAGWDSLAPETLQALPENVVAALPDEVQAQGACELDLSTPADPPDLPPNWQELAGVIGVEQLQTAGDLIVFSQASCQAPSAILNGVAQQNTTFVTALSADTLSYLAEAEADFYANLQPSTISLISWEAINALPEGVQEDLFDQYNPVLGSAWQDLSEQPEMANAGFELITVADLVAFEGDPAATISMIVSSLHGSELPPLGEFCQDDQDGFCEFAILLMSDLSPRAIEAIVRDDPDFLSKLAASDAGQVALTYLPVATLNSETVSLFIDDLENSDLKSVLSDIRDGNTPSAEAALQERMGDRPEPDPDAPGLPSSWAPVGNFIGAPLQQADDILNTRFLPDYESGADFINSLAADSSGQNRVRELPAEVWLYLGNNEQNFWSELSASSLRLIDQNAVPQLPQSVQERISAGGEPFEAEDYVTRTDGNSSLVITIFKDSEANTVSAWHDVEETLDDIPDTIDVYVPFEQASFIEESLAGVQREGITGAIMATIVILIFMNLSLRSTLVTAVSIPTSLMTAFFLMEFIPSNVNALLSPLLEDIGRDTTLGSILEVIIRLFPESYTLNIMTLSGLTVAIGRVVDDSIVVLENIYRNIQRGDDQREAILTGTREVSVAILAATATTMVVFLPLGLFGGVVGAFFLPFGLAVTYSLVGSYAVAITTVPALAYFFINKETIPAEGQIEITDKMGGYEKSLNRTKNVLIGGVDALSNAYSAIIHWVLRNRIITITVALLSLGFGLYLIGQRPQQFLPNFGEPQITIQVSLPSETNGGEPTTIAATDARVRQLERTLLSNEDAGVTSILTSVGGDPQQSDFFGGANVAETEAVIQIGMETQEDLDTYLPEIRAEAEELFGEEYVTVSGASMTGGFGGFALELSGPEGVTLQELAYYDEVVLETLNEIDGLVNVESSLQGLGVGGDDATYIRIDGVPAIRYTAELESEDSLGVTDQALQEAQDAVDAYREANRERLGLTTDVTVTQGFESEQQVEGFQQIFISMALATLIVYLLLALTFGHIIHPITILVSLPLSVVGAAIALTITDRALGLSAMIGLLMLIGIVVTNAVVLLDRVQQNRREKDMSTYDALVEAGNVRLRPILMTATSTTFGVLPLALGLSDGAIIAAELGTVVIGGLVSSTILTLLVVPVVYSLFDTLIQWILGFGRKSSKSESASAND
ncbi:MAG: efflux RND transporter permease subunit [Chloroflexi bacterium]|nr:efflux RND transporter permease subunit [Chloroflexota bacterium]